MAGPRTQPPKRLGGCQKRIRQRRKVNRPNARGFSLLLIFGFPLAALNHWLINHEVPEIRR